MHRLPEVFELKKQITITAAAASAAVLAALAGGGAAGAQDGSRTLSLVAVEQGCAGADNGRRGDSVGDLTACRGTLRDSAGATVGRVHWTCVYLGRERFGEDCSAVVTLGTGTLQLAGALSHTSAESTWAVTGGTGGYAGARGTVALRQLSSTRTAATINLLP